MTPVVTCDRLDSVTRPVNRSRDDQRCTATTTISGVLRDHLGAARQRVSGPCRPWLAEEVATERHILRESQRHADGGGTETVVEA